MTMLRISGTLRIKLGCLVVHCEEALSKEGHPLDFDAIRGIVEDEEVQGWLKHIDRVYLPVKR